MLLRRNIALTVLIAVVVLFLVVNGFLYFGWQSAKDRQADLERDEELANLQLINAQRDYDLGSLQDELRELENSPNFPSEVPSVELSVYLADAAAKYSVTLVGVMLESDAGSEVIGGMEYPRSEFDISVTGSLTGINSFLRYLEEGPFPGLEIENVCFTLTEEQGWEGGFTMVILSQPLTEDETGDASE